MDKVGANPLKIGGAADEDTTKLIVQLQKMLFELGYLLDSGSRFIDGVDGKFGPATRAAVQKFQQDHKDWEGNQLSVDGEVGELTGDALNREMVGIWYPHYLSVDKDGNSVPTDRPLATHDYDNPLKIPVQLFQIELHAQSSSSSDFGPDRTENYIPNDPSSGTNNGSTPPRFVQKEAYRLFLHSSDSLPTWQIRNAPPAPLPNVTIGNAAPAPLSFPAGTDTTFYQTGPPPTNFPIAGRFPTGGSNAAGTGDFQFQREQVHVCLARTVRTWRLLGLRLTFWRGGNPMHVTLQDPDASLSNGQPSLNAFYSQDNNFQNTFGTSARLALGFNITQGPSISKPFAADSADVTSHEAGHATLDVAVLGSADSALRTVQSFHESFGDMSAILTTLTDADVRKEMLNENGGDISKSNLVSRVAEEFGKFFDPNSNALREAASGDTPGANMPNGFKYVNPDTIPLLNVDELKTNPLVKGDGRTSEVTDLQKMLLALGFNLGNTGPNNDGVDGVFGDLTQQAVTQFQQNNNLNKVDGIVGQETSSALNSQAGFEIHDFSRIFTKAFYDSLVNAFNRLCPSGADADQKDSALRQAAGCIGTILARAATRASSPMEGFYRVIAQNMFAVDSQIFSKEFRSDMIGSGDGNGFVGRNIVKQSEVDSVSPPA